MNNRQLRKTGWIVVVLGCILIVASRLWLGLACVAVGLALVTAGARCPHCGKALATLSPVARVCPRCRNIF